MTQLGRYEILQHLATGPVADVLLARSKGLEGFTRHVVVKQIRPELATDERFVKAFLNEARIGASLHHQNIVQVYDIDEDRGAYYFTMEYVHGEDVRKLLLKVREDNALVPLDQVVTIGAAAAAGLHHAHEQTDSDRSPLGLVHRDVSPGNILIGFDGSVKLVDFGLAKPALSSIKTRTGSIAGKAPYMSPELCQGKPIDRRSDIFALGIVLYELATARRLFKGDNDYLTMASIVEGQVAPPSTIRPDIPRALDEIILRALAKKPEARFQTAVDLRAALEAFAMDAELRTTSKALADYMSRLFGPRTEPWLAGGTKPALAIDSESDFDESSLGLVLAPRSVEVKAVADAPIAVARAKLEPAAPFVAESPSRTALDQFGSRFARPDEEPTSTATATLTVAEALVPTDIPAMESTTVRGGPHGEATTTRGVMAEPPTVRAAPRSVLPSLRDEAPTTPTPTVPPGPTSATMPAFSPLGPPAPPAPIGPSARHSAPMSPAIARTTSSPPVHPSPPVIAAPNPSGLPAPHRSSASVPPPIRVTPQPPAILGTPQKPLPTPAPPRIAPLLPLPRFDQDDDELSDDSAADEATTVQPPLFPPPEVGGRPSEPEFPIVPPSAVEPMPMALAMTPAPPLRPPWMRYMIVALGLAIPLAVGFGSRSCEHDVSAGMMP
jgi:serine/threonine-protein kinase